MTLREKNGSGIAYKEAVQLLLWTYCTTDILPSEFKNNNIGRKEIVETFEKLAADNFITELPEEVRNPSLINWDGFIDKLLSKSISLDPDFPKRVSKFV